MVASSTIVEVFKTNVVEVSQASKILAILHENFPGNRINFDLHDCDKILRIEGKYFDPTEIAAVVQENGFSCTVLE